MASTTRSPAPSPALLQRFARRADWASIAPKVTACPVPSISATHALRRSALLKNASRMVKRAGLSGGGPSAHSGEKHERYIECCFSTTRFLYASAHE